MTAANEQTSGPAVKRPIILCPWLVALAALVLYGLTLNHWVTFDSLPFAAQITGWNWHPGPLPWRQSPQYPLFLILTLPLRLLPAGWQVMGLNVFTAVCAALTLAILARSVRLFSHDRTKEQRLREGGEFALLSVRAAFLPAAFAVLLLAAQLTFWENSVVGTGEMINLLVFAFLIYCLLDFRISQSEWRLNLFAFVYGLGAANSWALIGFFPCFLLALIWIKRIGFFNWKFALRMTGWGALGLLLYGLIPLLGAIRHDGTFWDLLHQKLADQHIYLTRMPRYFAAIAALQTLVPLLFAAINWPSFEGELVAGAHDITRLLFRVLHIVFLAVGVSMFFDVKSSPRGMGLGTISGVPDFLSFYYLAALSAGYFSGYVLLVFGKDVAYRWGQATGILRAINVGVVGLLWAAAVGLPSILFYENYQHIHEFNNPAVTQFGAELAKGLPAKPAVILADDPDRLYLAMGASERLGLPDQYIFIESRDLTHREYLRYLVERYPAFRKEITNNLPDKITSLQIGGLLAHLARRQPVYYLHPSFGSYFERVCLTPRRLGGDLHPYPTNALATLAPAPEEITSNQAYWHTLEKGPLASLPELAKTSGDARRIANYYSQTLDYWGTELQKAGTELKLSPTLKDAILKDAHDQFAEASRLNPDNMMAQINEQFNADLRRVPHTGPLISSTALATEVNNHWDLVYNLLGPADVPDLDIQIGRYFATNNAELQAAHLFQRCLDLAPNEPVAQLDLAKTYLDLGLVDPALRLLKEIHQPPGKPLDLELVRVEAMAYAKKSDFADADKLLTEAHIENPKDENFSAVMADFYRRMGYSLLSESNGDPIKEKEAAKWFEKALNALDAQLQVLSGPMQVTPNAPKIPAISLRKAEMQMMLKHYPDAIITLTALAHQYPEDPRPILNRAISELQINRLDAAKQDYLALEKKEKTSSMVYYGLAQVAQKQNDKVSEIKYDKLYLKYALPDTLEFTNVTQQLHKLEGH